MIGFTEDFHRGAITAEQWGRLDAEVAPRIQQGEAALANLADKLAEVESDFTTEDIDRVLDNLQVLREMVKGRLTADSTRALNLHLREVFEQFIVRSQPNDAGTGTRIIVEPRFRLEWLPQVGGRATPRQVDFSEEDAAGVEVVEHLQPVLRAYDITDGFITCSS